MLQWSVYRGVVNDHHDAKKHQKCLVTNLPLEGYILFLQISEKPFAYMKILLGARSIQEKSGQCPPDFSF